MSNSSREYSIFKFLKENREINTNNVNKIVQSIKEWGVIPGRPILVDKDLNIIDGQHRFMALKQLGYPIQYETIQGDAVAKTMTLNSTQSSWKLIDYIKSYSEQNIDCYRKLIKFEEKHNLGISNSINIFCQVKLKGPEFRKGKVFLINNDADDIVEFILSLKELGFYKQKTFIEAIVSLFKKANQNQINIIKNNHLKIPKSVSVNDYITVFENMINYKKRSASIIKL